MTDVNEKTYGAWNVKEEWDNGGWSKLDALTIIITRFQWIIFIVSIVVGILVGIFIEDKVKINTVTKEPQQNTLLPETTPY